LKKGAKVLVEGRLDYDPKTGGPYTWEGQDGAFHTGFGLVAQVVRFMSPKGQVAAHIDPADGDFGGNAEPDIPF
jgi:single-stranded DNA-binding protein